MFDGHGFLRSERARVGATAALALGLAAFASIGVLSLRRSWARHRHSPFAFDEYTWPDALGVGIGLAVGVPALIRWWRLGQQLSALEATQDFRFFLRAGAPRAIHGLLLAVAARDGKIDERERGVVHRVLLRDLPDGVVPQDLKSWSVSLQERDPIATASKLAQLLEPAERLAVLRWCREVAAADGEVDGAESELLRDVARVLGSPSKW
jgi:uncharacterized tellurite resistance protein B-like protein